MSDDVRGGLYSLGAALAWAGAVVLWKKVDGHFSAAGMNHLKNTLAVVAFALTLVLITPFADLASLVPPADHVLRLVISGALGLALGDTLFFVCLKKLGASRTAIVDCSYAPFVISWAALLLGEHLALADALGGVFILGAIVLSAAVGPRPQTSRRDQLIGYGAGLLSMATMGLSIVWVKPILETTPILVSTATRMAGGVIFLTGWALLRPSSRREILAAFRPSPAFRIALPAVFLGTYVSPLLWIGGFKYASANTAAILNQTSTLFIVIFAALFLGERLSARRGAAVLLALVGAGLVLVN